MAVTESIITTLSSSMWLLFTAHVRTIKRELCFYGSCYDNFMKVPFGKFSFNLNKKETEK